jgi:hypothetical protein
MEKNDYSFVLLGCKGKPIIRLEDTPRGTKAVPFILSGEVTDEVVKICLGDAGMTLMDSIRNKNGDKPSKTVGSRTPKK